MTELLAPGAAAISLGLAQHRWVLWHVTANCNLECEYCYGSFAGGSYKRDFQREWDVELDCLLQAARSVKDLGFARVHVNGGEPLLRRDIWEFYRGLHALGLEVWTLTNGTVVAPTLEQNLAEGTLARLAVSIDSLDVDYGERTRGKTRKVLATLEQLAAIKVRHGLETKLGIYVVLTPQNIGHVRDLVDHVLSLGFDYVNMQPTFLPAQHRHRDWLSFTAETAAAAIRELRDLRLYRDRCATSSDALLALAQLALTNSPAPLRAKDCFADQGDYLYIGPRGEVRGCPSKPSPFAKTLGNIRDEDLGSIFARTFGERKPTCCTCLSLDCLGMYEMAYHLDYESLPHVPRD